MNTNSFSVTGVERRPNTLLTRLCWFGCLALLVIVAYIALFAIMVNRGHLTYGIDDGTTRRGGGAYYWFSRNKRTNDAAGKFFWPILRGSLKCRRSSSFQYESEIIQWFESEHDVFMDEDVFGNDMFDK